jgi:MFS family permease
MPTQLREYRHGTKLMRSNSRNANSLKRLHLSVFAASIGLSYFYLIPAFAEQLGASYLDLGWIGTVRSMPYTFLPVIAGYLGDKFGKRRLYLLSIFAIGAATLLLAAADTIPDILAVQIVLGVGLALFWPISEALVFEISSLHERAAAIGMYAVAWGSGFLIGPLVGGIVAQGMGFQISFLIAGVLVLATSTASVVGVPRERRQSGDRQEAPARPSWKLIFSVLPMLLVQIPYAIVLSFTVSIFPGYAAASGLEPSEVGLLLSGFGFARTIAFSLASRMERFGERKSVGFAFLGMALVLLLIPTNRSFLSLLADSCLVGVFIGIIYPQTVGYVVRRSPPENLGFAIGAYETVFGIGFTIGPILTGFVAQTMSPDLALLALAIISLAIIPVLVFTKREAPVADAPILKL